MLLAEYKRSGKLYAIKALKKGDIVTRDEVDRYVISSRLLQNALTLVDGVLEHVPSA